jgi:hypothetical protein
MMTMQRLCRDRRLCRSKRMAGRDARRYQRAQSREARDTPLQQMRLPCARKTLPVVTHNGLRPTNNLVIPPVMGSEAVSLKPASSISRSHAPGLGKSAMESLR